MVQFFTLLAAAEPDASEAPETIAGTFDRMLETVHDVWGGFVGHVPLIVGGLVVVAVTWVLVALSRRVTERLLGRLELRPSVKHLIQRFVRLGIWLLGLTLAAMIVFPDLSPTDALTALGLVSVAVGLAFRDIFENFFAGILILWRFPFEPGDLVECSGITGWVEDITLRNTLIRSPEGELVIVPNSVLFKNPCTVLTDRGIRRVTVIAGVAYGEDVDASRELIRKAVETCETVRDDRPVEIFAREFGSSSINFEVSWWTGAELLDIRRSRDEVVAAVKRALDEAGIEIPFPYRTLTFKEPLETRTAESQPFEPRS